jgi:hypothetical protein
MYCCLVGFTPFRVTFGKLIQILLWYQGIETVWLSRFETMLIGQLGNVSRLIDG